MASRFWFTCTAGFTAWIGVCNAAPDPLDPKAAVTAPAHRSAFDGYRRHDDVKPLPWQQANDTVGRIGGWRSYAREAAAAPPSQSASTPAAKPPTAPAAPERNAPPPRQHH